MSNEKEKIETIDCTPTWEAVIRPMVQAVWEKGRKNKQIERDFLSEFINMAMTADAHVAYVKSIKKEAEDGSEKS